MKTFFLNIFWILLAYLFGSIPWGLIIGKVFYKTDIRQHGSGNLGGTNAGRVLGKKAGITVALLDIFKATIFMSLCQKFHPNATVFTGFFVAIGHCYPIFAQFKGGKAVACAVGYLLGLGVLAYVDIFFIFVSPILIFFLSLALTRYVSLSSICCVLSAFIIANIVSNKNIIITIFCLLILVIYRHIPNIKRIIIGKEPKINWIR